MSMFCNESGCEKNPLCCSREYYRNQYRVDDDGRQLPLTFEQLLNIDTVIVGNLVFSSNGSGRVVVVMAQNANNVRNRGLFG